MSESIITEAVLAQIRKLLATETSFEADAISFEIQEDGYFLLISIEIDKLPESQPISPLRRLASLLNGVMPSRAEDNSWMVTFTREGKVVDSYFGGNLASPNLGL